MAYNNFQGYTPSYNRGGGYNRYQNTRRSYGNNSRGGGKKHSGAKSGTDRNGKQYVRGWNYNKRFGLRSFYCAPYKGTDSHKSGSGRQWENWMVRIQQQGKPEELASGLYDRQTGRVIIKELGYVINPSKNYCGGYGRRN